MSGELPSFGRLVFGRAISDTAHFLGYKTRDIILGGIALILGIFCAYIFVGKADTLKEVALLAAFTLAPGGIILFAVFIWHLWLAPAALAYEATKAIPSQSPAHSPLRPPRKPEINWEIWKKMPQYTALEFAAILAHKDPVAGNLTNDIVSFLRLIDSDMKSKKLPYIRVIKDSYSGTYTAPIDDTTPIRRDDAIKWAKDKGAGFSVDHIL